MTPRFWRGTAALAMLSAVLSRGAMAADPARPSEDMMFGEDSGQVGSVPDATQRQPVTRAEKAEPPEGGRPRDEGKVLDSSESSKDAFASGEVADDALELGGIYYQRFIFSAQNSAGASGSPISLPTQFDGFLDARPNDRLRGFVDARLFFDSTRDQYSRSTSGGGGGSLQFSSASTAPTSFGGTAVATPNNPTVALDQAWLKFDVARSVFVTAGKQHVKWGAARFWNPTDFLHVQRRDPLLPYDMRLGNTMVKFELPWEARQTNFYAIALFDNPQPASTLGQMGGAFRAESVLGPMELGVELIARGGLSPVYGGDLSTPIGPFDLYVEAALLTSAQYPDYRLVAPVTTGADLSALVATGDRVGPFVQASGGISYTFGWKDNRLATVGAEYFYNQLGYSDAAVYPVLIYLGQYQPFYTGKQYAALFATAEGPDEQKRTSYTFSTLGNLSDMSFISRFDFSWRTLTYLTFEAYGDVHYGNKGGEFNFSLNTPQLAYGGVAIPAVYVPTTVFDLGMGLRLSF